MDASRRRSSAHWVHVPLGFLVARPLLRQDKIDRALAEHLVGEVEAGLDAGVLRLGESSSQDNDAAAGWAPLKKTGWGQLGLFRSDRGCHRWSPGDAPPGLHPAGIGRCPML